MSINPIGGASPAQGHVGAGNVSRPEAKEAPGAPEHDGDSDDAGKKVAAANASSAAAPGRVNVRA